MSRLYPRQHPLRHRPPHIRQADNLKTHAQHIARISRINNPVIDQHTARRITLRIAGNLLPEPLHLLLQLVGGDRLAFGLCARTLHRLHHAGELVGTHDAAPARGPGEQESRFVGPAAHGVVARAVGRAQDDGDVWYGRAAHGGDHLRAHLDDTRVLGFGADHEAGDVVEEDDGYVSGCVRDNSTNEGEGSRTVDCRDE